LAKASLKGNYLKAFLISLVLSFASGSGNGSSGSTGEIGKKTGEYLSKNPRAFVIVVAIIILSIAFRLLLGYSLEVGSKKYYSSLGQFKSSIAGYYSYAFDSTNYKGIISTMLLRDIYNFLWSLLFIIPGIIKAYSYRMVPFILTDNPNMGPDNAITLSRRMMDGSKFDSFVLDLSFIGWYILGLLAFVVGIFFVNPYVYATEAQLYLVLRKNAFNSGYCSYEDLNIPREFNDNYFNYHNNDENN